jgi:hypothetical protein
LTAALQRVEAAVVLERAGHQRLDLGAAADVAGDDVGVAARLADALRHLRAGFRLAAGDHDLRAHLRHQLGGGAADAAARPGDDGDLAGEIEGRCGHGGVSCHVVFSPSLRGAQATKQSSLCTRHVQSGLLRFARNDDEVRSPREVRSTRPAR